jgi:polar amino acid transport system substrate-binding protein
MRIWRNRAAVPFAVLCLAALAGCGSSKSSSSSSSASTSSSPSTTAAGTSSTPPAANPVVAKLVPSTIKSKGTLTVAADASYAPNEFIGPDGHTVVGMDADLMKELGGLMGLKVNVVNQTFDSIIPGLAAGKYQVGASSFTDTKAREKTVDFVDYFVAGESFFTKASGGTTITGLSDLCGHTVAVEKGTTEQADATTQSAKCKAAGKPAVTVLAFPDQNGANLALSSGRAQLGFADSPVAAYQVKQSGGQFKLVGPSIANAPYGLAVPKNSGLAVPLLAALKVAMGNGAYTKILTHWGIQAGAIKAPKVNGATS